MCRATSARVRHSLVPSSPKRNVTTVRSLGVRLALLSSIHTEADRSAISARSMGGSSSLGNTSTSSDGSDFDFTTPWRLTVTLLSSQASRSSTSARGISMKSASCSLLGVSPLRCISRALAARNLVSFSLTLTGIRIVRLWVDRARFSP